MVKRIIMIKKFYSVWVGGSEVVDHLVTIEDANKIFDHYISEGYTDVQITEYD